MTNYKFSMTSSQLTPRYCQSSLPIIAGLTLARRLVLSVAVTLRPENERFLRAAVKTGLRLQRNEPEASGGKTKSTGVSTLQRIKASLRKRNINNKSTL